MNIEAIKIIKAACRQPNIKPTFIGKYNKVFNNQDYINQADIVISLGRGAREAMSCGKAVMIFAKDDNLYNGGDGMVTSENIDEIAQHNFSTRALKLKFDVPTLISEMKKYHPGMEIFNRQYVLDHYDFDVNISQLIKIYQKAIEEGGLKYDQKIVANLAQNYQAIFDYQKLQYRHTSLKKIWWRKTKDRLKDWLKR